MTKFFKKLILLIRGQLPDYTEYVVRVNSLSTQLRASNERVRYLEGLLKENIERIGMPKIYVSGFDGVEPEPSDPKERRMYAGRVSSFYEEILREKIRVSIADIRQALAAVGTGFGLPQNMTRTEYDFLLRGMEAGLWKIHDWVVVLEGELKNKEE
jgi:hypothetical protein